MTGNGAAASRSDRASSSLIAGTPMRWGAARARAEGTVAQASQAPQGGEPELRRPQPPSRYPTRGQGARAGGAFLAELNHEDRGVTILGSTADVHRLSNRDVAKHRIDQPQRRIVLGWLLHPWDCPAPPKPRRGASAPPPLWARSSNHGIGSPSQSESTTRHFGVSLGRPQPPRSPSQSPRSFDRSQDGPP
jgi:hypothetical protein